MSWRKYLSPAVPEPDDRETVIAYLEDRNRWLALIPALPVAAFSKAPKYLLPTRAYCEGAGVFEISEEKVNSVFQNFRSDFPKFSAALDGINNSVSRLQELVQSTERTLEKHIREFQSPMSIFDLRNLAPKDFEKFISKFFECDGYRVKVVGRSNDGGIDVVAVKQSNKLVIQCKRYKVGNNVGAEVIQTTAGNLLKREYTGYRALVITTSSFTSSARKQAQEFPQNLIELWDGQKLMHRLNEQARAGSPNIKSAKSLIAEVSACRQELPKLSLGAARVRVKEYASKVDGLCGSTFVAQVPDFERTLASVPIPSRPAQIPTGKKNKVIPRLLAGAACLGIAVFIFAVGNQTTSTGNYSVSAAEAQPSAETLSSQRKSGRTANLSQRRLKRLLRALPSNEFHRALPRLYADLEEGRLCAESKELRRVRRFVRLNRVVTSREVARYWDKIVSSYSRCDGTT